MLTLNIVDILLSNMRKVRFVNKCNELAFTSVTFIEGGLCIYIYIQHPESLQCERLRPIWLHAANSLQVIVNNNAGDGTTANSDT